MKKITVILIFIFIFAVVMIGSHWMVYNNSENFLIKKEFCHNETEDFNQTEYNLYHEFVDKMYSVSEVYYDNDCDVLEKYHIINESSLCVELHKIRLNLSKQASLHIDNTFKEYNKTICEERELDYVELEKEMLLGFVEFNKKINATNKEYLEGIEFFVSQQNGTALCDGYMNEDYQCEGNLVSTNDMFNFRIDTDEGKFYGTYLMEYSKENLTIELLNKNCECYYGCMALNSECPDVACEIECPECNSFVCGDYFVEVQK